MQRRGCMFHAFNTIILATICIVCVARPHGARMASSGSGGLENPPKRQKTLSDLLSVRGVSKGGLAKLLQSLNDGGLIA